MRPLKFTGGRFEEQRVNEGRSVATRLVTPDISRLPSKPRSVNHGQAERKAKRQKKNQGVNLTTRGR